MIKIIGIGNPLMGDDGLGIAAVDLLVRQSLPPYVEVIDGGTGGISLLHLFEHAERVILIDAVDMDSLPGTFATFQASEIIRSHDQHLSLHQTGLPQVLALAGELGPLPDIVLYGMQPETIHPRPCLSPAAAAAVPKLVKRILADLRR